MGRVFFDASPMRAYSHLLFGAGSWVALCHWGAAPAQAASVAAAMAASLLPDIDHPKSFVGRRLWFLSVPLAAVLGHRGMTHSLLAIGLWIWLLLRGLAWDQELTAAAATGYLSHLAGDWLTVGGIPLLWPWRRRFQAPLSFKSGGATEWALDIGLLAWLVWGLGLVPHTGLLP
jgi:inner membrane protein